MTKRRVLKYITTAAAALIVFGSLTACSGTTGLNKPVATAESGQQIQYQEVTGTVSYEQADSKLKVTATSNLTDGTIYKVAVDGCDGQAVDSKILTKGSEESPDVEFDITDAWPSDIRISLVAQPSGNGKQPSEVTDVYGKKFELMSGEDVIWNTEGNVLVIQSDKITLNK